MKGGKYTKTLAKIQVIRTFRTRDIRRNVLPKFMAELSRAKRAPAQHHRYVNLPIPENLVIT